MKKSAIFCSMLLIFTAAVAQAEEHESYSRGVLDKAGNGAANISTAMLEIPKNIINTTNDSNIVFGVLGGMLKGTVNMVGRMGVGMVDLVTAPIPTQPIVHPALIWDDFDVDTQYGKAFRLSKDHE
jgi:putative exosortase-associated protein (TIGR04073 family)